MARPAGGPKPPQGKKDFDEDDWGWCSSSCCSFNPEHTHVDLQNIFYLFI